MRYNENQVKRILRALGLRLCSPCATLRGLGRLGGPRRATFGAACAPWLSASVFALPRVLFAFALGGLAFGVAPLPPHTKRNCAFSAPPRSLRPQPLRVAARNRTKRTFCIIASEMRRRRGKAAHKFLGQLPAPFTVSALNALQRVARNPRRARNARYRESKMDVLYGCAPCRLSRCVLVRFYILFASLVRVFCSVFPFFFWLKG